MRRLAASRPEGDLTSEPSLHKIIEGFTGWIRWMDALPVRIGFNTILRPNGASYYDPKNYRAA